MKKVLSFLPVLLLLCGCVPERDMRDRSVGYASPEPQAISTPESATRGNAENLAIIDGVNNDPVKLNRFKSLLGQLDEVFVEDETQIADMTVNTQELLKTKGVSESLLNIMEGMNRLFSQNIGNQKYQEYLVSYINLRDNGESHDEAIKGLIAFNKALGIPN